MYNFYRNEKSYRFSYLDFYMVAKVRIQVGVCDIESIGQVDAVYGREKAKLVAASQTALLLFAINLKIK